MGSSTDAAHSINEKLDRRNYIEGTKLLGAYSALCGRGADDRLKHSQLYRQQLTHRTLLEVPVQSYELAVSRKSLLL